MTARYHCEVSLHLHDDCKLRFFLKINHGLIKWPAISGARKIFEKRGPYDHNQICLVENFN